mgnify:CR=1 FL=1|tara:strand:+ start:456 stop:668 length:213 start_codon:yes stop_codon:yes gene_type:complete
MKPEPTQPLTLTINGSEEELRHYLKSTHYHSILWNLEGQCRNKLKHGHDFENADEVLRWVRSFMINLEEE